VLNESNRAVALLFSILLLCGCAKGKGEQLVVAASDGDIPSVRRLLDQKVSIESKALDGLTPLKAAAMQGRLDVVELLCSRGASINGGPNDDDTPLTIAAIHNHTEVAAFLLAHGGKIRGTRATNEDLLQSLQAKHNEQLYALVRDQLQKEHPLPHN
jgi:ankyrin repeat protein